eukprot:6213644-Pleurochrysis_carterae.AAC.7
MYKILVGRAGGKLLTARGPLRATLGANRARRMADTACPSSASRTSTAPAYPLTLMSQAGSDYAEDSFRKRERPMMLVPLAQVQNVRPTRLERRTKTGARIR